MQHSRKVLAIIAIILLLIGLLFSYEYIYDHAHHECSGEDCPVCLSLDEAVQLISAMSWLPIWIIVAVFSGGLTQWETVREEIFCRRKTLITLKVELLN